MSEQGIERVRIVEIICDEIDTEESHAERAADRILATPPVPAGEVEVTPAMLEAGEIAWQAWGHAEPVELAIRRIYLAMRRAALSSQCTPR
jgi:hypothetical protein